MVCKFLRLSFVFLIFNFLFSSCSQVNQTSRNWKQGNLKADLLKQDLKNKIRFKKQYNDQIYLSIDTGLINNKHNKKEKIPIHFKKDELNFAIKNEPQIIYSEVFSFQAESLHKVCGLVVSV